MYDMLMFNADDGYLEGIVRGFKDAILTSAQYVNLTQCETLDDLKLQLQSTDYGQFLANEPSPLATSTIAARCTDKLVEEFQYLRGNAVQPLAQFLDYITYGYMIDNVILLITGTLHARDTRELLARCHPLGVFDTMAALCVASNVAELYSTVLVETPLAPYFANCLSAHDLDEMNIEIIRNTLYKAYIEDFSRFCASLGGTTAEVMGDILKFEADRRAITITVNSFGTELGKDERSKLFPTNGRLYPVGLVQLARADDVETVRSVCDSYPEYRSFYENFGLASASGDKSLDDRFFEYEVRTNKIVFFQQYHYGLFYAYLKLKEQEVRNVVWIAECISQQQKDKINNYIPIF